MIKNTIFRSFAVMALASAMLSGTAMAADDPTLHQVYQAAESGKMAEAQEMMQKVLRDHPNSGKAHFVEAELLAKQGRFSSAETELATAERLDPGLPFAKPAAVQDLKSLFAKAHTQQSGTLSPVYTPSQVSSENNAGTSMPWGIIILGAGVIALIVFFVRRNNGSQQVYAGGGRYGSVNPMPQPGYAPGTYGAYPQQATSGGIGSGIVGGLATGAAVGAGIVAGEALMHHFTDGDRSERSSGMANQYLNNNDTPVDLTRNDDMGGNDFGVSDASSWDDGDSSGGDWDN